MKIRFAILFVFVVTTITVFGQNNYDNKDQLEGLMRYIKFFHHADSIGRTVSPGFLNAGVYRIADSLDKENPVGYFMKVADFMKDAELNDASFIYYLGCLRFRYYNASNPDYKDSSDGALLGSFQATIGEPIDIYLKSNAANFAEILKKASDWYFNHDSSFQSKTKAPEKFKAQYDGIHRWITDIENNKATYQADWDKQIKEMDKMLNEGLGKISTKGSGE